MWAAAVKKILILSSFSWLYINSAAFSVITACPWGWWQSPPQGFPVIILPLTPGHDDAERSKNWNRAGSDRKWLQMLSLWKNYTIKLNWIRSEEHRNLFLWTNKHHIKNDFHPKIKFAYIYSSATLSFIYLDGFGVSCSVLQILSSVQKNRNPQILLWTASRKNFLCIHVSASTSANQQRSAASWHHGSAEGGDTPLMFTSCPAVTSTSLYSQVEAHFLLHSDVWQVCWLERK